MDINETSKESKRFSRREISKLIRTYSVNDLLKSEFLKKRFKNDDVDIYPGKLEIAIQMYESTTDFKLLNKAKTLEDYEKVYDFLELKEFLSGRSPKKVDESALNSLSPENLSDSLLQFMYFLEKFSKESFELSELERYSLSSKKYIIFPIHTLFIDNYNNKIKFAGHHASLAILEKFSNFQAKIYIIDSDNITNRNKDVAYSEKKYESYVCKKVKYSIETLLNPFGFFRTQRVSVEFLDIKTPQSITKDDYCIFWSFALTEELFKNSSEVSKRLNPSKIIDNFMKKYKTKKQLQKFILNYIKNVVKV
jgi:hypothetical protein